jgi:hypothetical protein
MREWARLAGAVFALLTGWRRLFARCAEPPPGWGLDDEERAYLNWWTRSGKW